MLLKHPFGVTHLAEGAAQELLPPEVVVSPEQVEKSLVQVLKDQNARLQAQLQAELESKQQLERDCFDLTELNCELLKVVALSTMNNQQLEMQAKGIKPIKSFSMPPAAKTKEPTTPHHAKTKEPTSPTQTSPTHSGSPPVSPPKPGSPVTTVLSLPYPTEREDGSPKKSTSSSFLGAFWAKPTSESDITPVCGNRRRRFGAGSTAKRVLFSVSDSELTAGTQSEGNPDANQKVKRAVSLPDGDRDPNQRSVSL